LADEAEIQVPDGPEACGPTCAIRLLGVEVQDATRETEVALPNRPALSCCGQSTLLRWSKVTFDDRF
jgi:hypothetical protein